MKKKGLIFLYGSIISVLTSCIAIGSTLTLFTKSANSNGPSGEISLHSYYECGSGTELDPFVITRPRHLYNLSRLQGLGIYGEKTYFKLGKVNLNDVNSSGIPMCYVGESDTQKPYLDMSDTYSNYSKNPINAIGSEAMPFYGVFDGQNVEIKGLTVYASPEDAGLFGYTARGSVVKNLFLDDITINAMGYTDNYEDLYDSNSTLKNYVSFEYDADGDSSTKTDITTYHSSSPLTLMKESHFAVKYSKTVYNEQSQQNEEVSCFEYNPDLTIEGSTPLPSVSIVHPNNNVDEEGELITSDDEPLNEYYPLLSGELIKIDANNNLVPDMDNVIKFFNSKRPAAGSEKEDDAYPIQTSATASIVVSNIDELGLKHSKVLLTLKFVFTLGTKSSPFINMVVQPGTPHTNNIGLVIGHCDGAASDCYVHKGTFVMNNGDAVAGTNNEFNNIGNGSSIGLIGLVGDAVENAASQQINDAIGAGLETGVLDFTSVYDSIIDSSVDEQQNKTSSNSFYNSSNYAGGGVTYKPITTSDYITYLRKNGNTYVTKEEDAISFKGQEVVTSTDLGVFTVATDTGTSGLGIYAGTSLQNSLVKKESNLAIDGKYYIYYSMGEYNKAYNDTYHSSIKFSDYLTSINSDKPSYLLKGNHLPNKDNIDKESFLVREQRQNYVFRFTLDSTTYRHDNGFYFSDVNLNSDGGAFVANYFSKKLVNRDNVNLSVTDPECGVMIRGADTLEIENLDCSFELPDFSGGARPSAKVFKEKKYVENTVNFEITTNYANVTVIAASTDPTKSSSLCVYPVNDNDFTGSPYPQYNNNSYNPDFAFFMPKDNQLTYFDYKIDSNVVAGRKGKIGIYNSDYPDNPNDPEKFEEAKASTNATVVDKYGYNVNNEHGYSSGKTRMFAHTFYLPKGRYCLGSNTNNNSNYAKSKVYYICAQGQEAGNIGHSNTAFDMDKVEKIDFVKIPRFLKSNNANEDGEILIDVNSVVTTYDPSSNKLANQRCYIALDGLSSNRSTFSDSYSDITFMYDGPYDGGTNKFLITTTLTEGNNGMNAQQLAERITKLSVVNYNHNLLGNSKSMFVNIFGFVENKNNAIAFPSGGS